ncbi:hypothetical protein L6R49_19275 [Myxococcota bacterium]|nr:hypothetical protein [Myxococcota bacterium]
MRLATVLYEDKMQAGGGSVFPPHDFLLAMVSDLTGLEIWALRRQIEPNPRNGVAKLIGDLSRTSLLAGDALLCVLVDRDRVAEHLRLPKLADEAAVIQAMKDRSDAPDKLTVHFLDPNLEGLMRSIADCAPGVSAPSTKDHNSRDLFLKHATFKLSAAARDCVKGKQASLGALVERLAGLCGRGEG